MRRVASSNLARRKLHRFIPTTVLDHIVLVKQTIQVKSLLSCVGLNSKNAPKNSFHQGIIRSRICIHFFRSVMSASHRRIAHLPLEIFDNLTTHANNELFEPADLRTAICNKLKKFRNKSKRGNASFDGIKNIGDLLQTSKMTLVRALDPLLTYVECETLLERICIQCAPTPISALFMLRSMNDGVSPRQSKRNLVQPQFVNRMRYLPTGLASLDCCLRGGIRTGTITELVGRAGTGKTQLALQLCVMAARYNLGAVYIDTEKKLSLQRLEELSTKRASLFNCGGVKVNIHDTINSEDHDDLYEKENTDTWTYKRAEEVLANLTVHSPASTTELIAAINMAEEEILHRNQEAINPSHHQTSSELPKKLPVGLLVIDSIAAPTRRDFGADSAPQRAQAIFQCAQSLKRLADQLHIGVIVINQVGLNQDSQCQTNGENDSDQVSVRAALGTAWHHCVSTRVLMEHKRDPHRLSQNNKEDLIMHQEPEHKRGRVRILNIVKSNVAALSTTQFEVMTTGLVEV